MRSQCITPPAYEHVGCNHLSGIRNLATNENLLLSRYCARSGAGGRPRFNHLRLPQLSPTPLLANNIIDCASQRFKSFGISVFPRGGGDGEQEKPSVTGGLLSTLHQPVLIRPFARIWNWTVT